MLEPNVEPFLEEPPAERRWATLDHVIPQSLGGSHRLDNLVIACHICNHEHSKKNDPLHYVPRPKGNA